MLSEIFWRDHSGASCAVFVAFVAGKPALVARSTNHFEGDCAMNEYLELCARIQKYPIVIWWTTSVLVSVAIWLSHYFSMFVTVGGMTVVNLRVLGLAARNQTVAQVADLYSKWMWPGIVVLVVSGSLMLAGDSVLFCTNGVFGIKLLLMVLAAISGVIIQSNAHKWDKLSGTPISAKVIALVSLALWIGTILAAVDVPALTDVP